MEFPAGVYLSEAQNHILPLYKMFTYTAYIFTQGKGGLNHREG